MLFGKKKTSSDERTTSPLREPEAGGSGSASGQTPGKGRPTPKRREAEAANRRPLVGQRQSGRRSPADKAKLRAERARARQLMMEGDQRYLPARDKGPERRFLRDAVDRRLSVGELLLPAMIVVLVLTFVPVAQVRASMFFLAYGFILVGILDGWLLWRRTKAAFTEAFGRPPGRGSASYVVLRAFQMRRSRIPRPAVQRGAALVRR